MSETVWPEGWSSVRFGRQQAFHYYRSGKSLCGKYSLAEHYLEFTTFTKPKDPHDVCFTSGSDCQACRRKMQEMAVNERKPSEESL
ncbi:hypothetical protein ABH922_002774 [Rhodococcus sp. 27YEA15]|uniref:hypothetical protein n=1 Tax=Rhodococcus sp. 27YEA15 TaxID=3156259 RepID=UPI003C7BA747